MLKWSLVAVFLSLVALFTSFTWVLKAPEATEPVAEFRNRTGLAAQRPGDTELVEGLLKMYAVPGDPSLVRTFSTRQAIVVGGSFLALVLSSAIALATLLYRLMRWIVRR
jgi:hypothetical protein